MKQQEKYELKYDGSIEEYLKQRSASQKNPGILINYHNRINQLAIRLSKKFPNCKNVNFVEVMKIAMELFQKRKSDEVVRDIGKYANTEFSGSFELLEYLKGVKSKTIASQQITIKYLEPIITGSKRLKSNELVIEGIHLVRTIEQILLQLSGNNKFENQLPKKVTKLNLYGRNESRKERFEAQYAKVACLEISNLLKSNSVDDNTMKEVIIFALESVNLIEHYRFYVLRKHHEAISKNDVVDIDKRGLWVSRTYRSILR